MMKTMNEESEIEAERIVIIECLHNLCNLKCQHNVAKNICKHKICHNGHKIRETLKSIIDSDLLVIYTYLCIQQKIS